MSIKKNVAMLTSIGTIIMLFIVLIISLILVNFNGSNQKFKKINGIIETAKQYYATNKEDSINKNIFDLLEIVNKPLWGDIRVNGIGQVALAINDDGKCFFKDYLDEQIIVSSYSETTCSLNIAYSSSINDLISNDLTGKDLFLDELDNSYRYKGSNPNNYIRLFEGDTGLFRIIAFEKQGIKLISANPSSLEQVWDAGGLITSECTDELCPRYNDNNTYCRDYGAIYDEYNGCSVWASHKGVWTSGSYWFYEDDIENGRFIQPSGTVKTDSTMLSYLKNDYYANNLTSLDDIIQTVKWKIGSVIWPKYEDKMSEEVYEDLPLNIQSVLTQESSKTWTGKIGLINPSDYVRSGMTNKENSCYENAIYNDVCGTENWLYYEGYAWTMNASVANYVWTVDAEYGSLYDDGVFYGSATYPVIYLSNDIGLSSGIGTSDNPYILN